MRLFVAAILLVLPVLVKAQKARQTNGEIVYNAACISCHQRDGKGVPRMVPSLSNLSRANLPNYRLISIVLNGLKGEEIEGDSYSSVMPAGAQLSDQQIADVLTYVLKHFGNKPAVILPAEVKALRK